MARAKRNRGKSRDNYPLIIICAALALVVVGAVLFKNASSDANEQVDNFAATPSSQNGGSGSGNSAADQYLKRGSSAVGNHFKIAASVLEVDSHGGSRVFKVRTQDNKCLGLFVPAGTKLDANVRAGMEYIFEVEGRNGTKPDGSSVKGILVVTQAKAK